jgi:hypothetical protein
VLIYACSEKGVVCCGMQPQPVLVGCKRDDGSIFINDQLRTMFAEDPDQNMCGPSGCSGCPLITSTSGDLECSSGPLAEVITAPSGNLNWHFFQAGPLSNIAEKLGLSTEGEAGVHIKNTLVSRISEHLGGLQPETLGQLPSDVLIYACSEKGVVCCGMLKIVSSLK